MLTVSTHLTGDIITAAKGNNWEIQAYDAIVDGWADESARTWTYASTTSFTVSGDHSTRYQKGQKMRLVQTSTKYFYNVGTSYSTATGNTTVTIGENTDYVLSSAAITAPAISDIENPKGFPHWFNWAPTVTGFSTNPTPAFYRFNVIGNTANIVIWQVAGASNAVTFTISAPIVSKTVAGIAWSNLTAGNDNSAFTTDAAFQIASASTTIIVSKNGLSTGWTAAGTKSANGTFFYEI